MPTAQEETGISAELLTGLEEAIDRLMKGVRDPEIMREAAREMDAAGGAQEATR